MSQDNGKTIRPRQTRKQRKQQAVADTQNIEPDSYSPINYEHSVTRYIINGILVVLIFGYGMRRIAYTKPSIVNPDKIDQIDFCNTQCSAWDEIPLYDIYRERFVAPMMTCACGNCTTKQPRHVICTNQGKDLAGNGPFWNCETEPVFMQQEIVLDSGVAYTTSIEIVWDLMAVTISCLGDQATGDCIAGTFHLEYEWDWSYCGSNKHEAAYHKTHGLQMMVRIQHWKQQGRAVPAQGRAAPETPAG